MERVVTSRKKIVVKKEEGWYSEAEMKSDLCWQQSLTWNDDLTYTKQSWQILTICLKHVSKSHLQVFFRGPSFRPIYQVASERSKGLLHGSKTACHPYPARAPAGWIRRFAGPNAKQFGLSTPAQDKRIWQYCGVLGDSSRTWSLRRGTWNFGKKEVDSEGRIS
jgi:hypothetical protein